MTEADRSISIADIGPGEAWIDAGFVYRRVALWLGGAGAVFMVFALFSLPPVRPLPSAVMGILLLTAAAASTIAGRTAGNFPIELPDSRWPGIVTGLGVLGLLVSVAGAGQSYPILMFWVGTGLLTIGGTWMIVARYSGGKPGIDNDGVKRGDITNRGALGWLLAIVMTGFYVILYWYPSAFEGVTRTMDPIAYALSGQPATQWFMYGTFYTLAILVMGVRALYRYRDSRYHVIRTLVLMAVQLVLAYVIPQILVLFNQPEFYFSYFWPLEWTYLWPEDFGIGWILSGGGDVGVFMVLWAGIMSFVATPILTYFYGKRWYCSWVCGCGGLAETAGDPFRHLAPRSLDSWRLERWLVHGSLAFIVVLTALLWVNSALEGAIFGGFSGAAAQAYGFLFGAVWAGVIGVGFYPVLGSRIWCRYGCPMAAILGLQQRFFSRFRITTNGGQCISCGNCSAYCEMGIDVRWYAQRGQNIIRASCVGCGVCSTVCPRGVLKLENGPREGRFNGPVLIDRDDVGVLERD